MTSSIFALAGLLYSGINQVASKLANASTEAQTAVTNQANSYGGAVIMDLSPAAQAALKASQPSVAAPPSTTSALSNVSAGLFSGMAQSYSAGNTGTLDTNNSYFDQLFANKPSAADTSKVTSGVAVSGSTGTSPANSGDVLSLLV